MENYQKAHFDRIAELYRAHYFDVWSMKYRYEFIYNNMFEGLDLNGRKVAEFACGCGHNSLVLKKVFPDIDVEGFDISPAACEDYRNVVGAPCHTVDLTTEIAVSDRFDAAFVVGGLHHCTNDLETTLKNIARLLKPGGVVAMLEPNRRHVLEFVRRAWYKRDSFFDANQEQALDHDELHALGRQWFRVRSVKYLGGPAFYAVLNSLILRIPLAVKPLISPPLLALERVWNRLPAPQLQGAFVAQWERLP